MSSGPPVRVRTARERSWAPGVNATARNSARKVRIAHEAPRLASVKRQRAMFYPARRVAPRARQ